MRTLRDLRPQRIAGLDADGRAEEDVGKLRLVLLRHLAEDGRLARDVQDDGRLRRLPERLRGPAGLEGPVHDLPEGTQGAELFLGELGEEGGLWSGPPGGGHGGGVR